LVDETDEKLNSVFYLFSITNMDIALCYLPGKLIN